MQVSKKFCGFRFTVETNTFLCMRDREKDQPNSSEDINTVVVYPFIDQSYVCYFSTQNNRDIEVFLQSDPHRSIPIDSICIELRVITTTTSFLCIVKVTSRLNPSSAHTFFAVQFGTPGTGSNFFVSQLIIKSCLSFLSFNLDKERTYDLTIS